MEKQNVVEWTDLIAHSVKLGFEWNYAHEILRIFQDYDGSMRLYCEEIDELDPLTDPYLSSWTKNEPFDLSQMGRDIVYDFMQMHGINEMLVIGS